MAFQRFFVSAIFAFCLLANVQAVFCQKPGQATKPPKQIIFAVLDDGKSVEPIAFINNRKLEAPVNGSDDSKIIAAFTKTYYKVGAVYRLIFGGAEAGTVTVKSSNGSAECSKTVATVNSQSTKATFKPFVMGLATNAVVSNKTVFRRKPSVAEKSEIDEIVRAEYAKHKLTPKVLHYQNLTAVDVNRDGNPEFVGSYWIEVDKLTRALLFFIAEKGSSGKYALTYSDFRSVDQTSVMSTNIKDVDNGIYHELLLDVFDIDGSGSAEIFTYEQSFEGAGFSAYRKSGSKWTRIFEYSDYHCGY